MARSWVAFAIHSQTAWNATIASTSRAFQAALQHSISERLLITATAVPPARSFDPSPSVD